MINQNTSATLRVNTTTGQDDLYIEENDTEVGMINLYVYNLLMSKLNFLPRVNLSMLFEDLEILKIEPNFYESNALVHVDGNPTIIPVTGVTYEYSNISDTQPYNQTTFNWTYPYSSETTLVQVHTNYTIQFEIHEPTKVLVNMLFTLYSNTTMSLFDVPYSTGSYLRLSDSHEVFKLSTETMTTTETSDMTTSKEKASGFLFISTIVAIVIIMIIRRRNGSQNPHLFLP